MSPKLFIGPKVRRLREARGWKLEACARQLDLSISYLSQIEANQRPVTARVLISLMRAFEVDGSVLDADDDQRLIADLREATADLPEATTPLSLGEIKQVATLAPAFARRYLELHHAYHRLDERLKLTDETISVDQVAAASHSLPYEEVRDFFHYKNNYVHELDLAAEALANALSPGEGALEAYLRDEMDTVVVRDATDDVMRRYDPVRRTLSVNPSHPEATRIFQLAFHVAAQRLSPLIERELAAAALRSAAAVDVCRVGLGNYAAGALLMPYRRFVADARELRHDVERLAQRYNTSLEQVCHRLSTLQRPGERGAPIYFVRVDYAGNITKRHSATRFQFARFGGTCPLWNVHEAIAQPDRFIVQVAEMPDGARYLCVARSLVKPSGSYLSPDRRYAIGIGCDLEHAGEMVYSQGVDLTAAPVRIGVSCRICERTDCQQRAFPPVDRRMSVPPDERRVVPFEVEG